MSEKARLNTILERVAALHAAGEIPKARAALDILSADPAIGDLGQITALGIPRRVQSWMLRLAKAEGDAVRRIGYQYHLVPAPERLSRFANFSLPERREINAANQQPVPRILHQIWIGALPAPPACAAWAAHAAAQGYAYKLWREADLAALGLPKASGFAAMLARGDYPGAVDVARYAILEREGGIYLDCDFYPARNDIGFHDLLPLLGLGALAEDIPRDTGMGGLLLANSAIFTPPGHPALRRLNAILPEVIAEMPDVPAWWSTGPLIFTLVARAGAVSVGGDGCVVGTLKRGAPFAAVQALCNKADGMGLLVAWKSW